MTVYPCGGPRPGTSNINTRIGVAAANNVIAALDSTRAVCIYASTATHLVVDLFGWYGATGMQYIDVAPVRALDTRPGGPRPAGTTGRVRANTPFVLPLAAESGPGEAEAVLVNLTVNGSLGPGSSSPIRAVREPPLASNVNFVANEDRAGSTMVGLGPDGSLCLLSNVDVHVIVDVNGYFVPGQIRSEGDPAAVRRSANRRLPRRHRRLVDTDGRQRGPFVRSDTRLGGVDNVYAASLNVIATEGAGAGHLRLFPCGGADSVGVVAELRPQRRGHQPGHGARPGRTVVICVFASIATQVVIDEFGTVAAPGLAKQLTISGAVPFPTFDADRARLRHDLPDRWR